MKNIQSQTDSSHAIFNFGFHPDNQHFKNEGMVILSCEGVPYTCGLYYKEGNGFYCESYIFPPGYGVAQHRETTICENEQEAQNWLISKAVVKILTNNREYIPETIGARGAAKVSA
jgi:hypothetical protein